MVNENHCDRCDKTGIQVMAVKDRTFCFSCVEDLASHKSMDKMPEGISLCSLQVVLMPNEEIICMGKTVGFFKDLKKYLTFINRGA